jgi:hypothetical protein
MWPEVRGMLIAFAVTSSARDFARMHDARSRVLPDVAI